MKTEWMLLQAFFKGVSQCHMALGVPSGNVEQARDTRLLSRRQALLVGAGTLGVAFGLSELLREGGNTKKAPTPTVPLAPRTPVELEQIEAASDLFLPESDLAGLSDAEREARIDAFKRAAPADVRTLENGTEFVIGRESIYMTIKKPEGYRKIRMEYKDGARDSQVLHVDDRVFVVKYLKVRGVLSNRVYNPMIVRTVKEEEGIANTARVMRMSDTKIMPFSDIESVLRTLSGENVPMHQPLAPTMLENIRMFYYVRIENTGADDEGELPDEKELAQALYKRIQTQMADAATIASDDESPHP